MKAPKTLLLAVGKAALNAAGAGLVGDALEIARAAWKLWQRSPAERLAELEVLAQADDGEIQGIVDEVVAEAAGDAPESIRMALTTILKQIPSQIRQSQRRPDDPSGKSIRPGLTLDLPEDLIPFFPERLPRFRPGDRPLAGVDWELVELLGIGGFGEVWKARHSHFDSFAPVALKFCLDPLARDRLLRHEAKVCARVMKEGRHPGIVTLQATYLSADPPCLQYEYVEGGDLGGLIRDWHRQARKPSAEQLGRAVLAIAEIVAFVHGLDPPIVHRDLKPANILVRGSGAETTYHIADFGIGGIATAKAVQANRQATTPSQFMTSAVRGACTPLYASPEQLRGHDSDPRDDVHALGVVWHQMLTGDLTEGRPGFGWRDEFRDRGLSDPQAELLESCFAQRPSARPDDASVLARRLRALLEPAAKVIATPVNPPPSAHPKLKPEIVNSIGMTLKRIPVGEFDMGSPDDDPDALPDEKPRHRVKIRRPFYLGANPVTQAEYQKVTGANPSHFKDRSTHPVEMVSWLDAVAFCNKLGAKEGLKPFYQIKKDVVTVADWKAEGYRLPTEAEWEYACRAGSPARYSFGDDVAQLDQYAWYTKYNAAQKGYRIDSLRRSWRLLRSSGDLTFFAHLKPWYHHAGPQVLSDDHPDPGRAN